MGLDMYLNAKRHFWTKEQAPRIEGVPEDYEVGAVDVDIAYWRKANAIHDWFVRNVQNGEDNCGKYEVTREHLQTLLDLCRQVKNDPSKAPELLPTAEGFFFGPTEYDEWYFDSLQETINQLYKALNSFDKNWRFEYHSSW